MEVLGDKAPKACKVCKWHKDIADTAPYGGSPGCNHPEVTGHESMVLTETSGSVPLPCNCPRRTR